MEHIEGKLETDQSCINCIDLLSKEDDSVVAQIMECEEDELSDTQRANAKEIVLRWNAFEKDGLVDELRTTCEWVFAEAEYCAPKNEEEGYYKLSQISFEKIIAAIAKAEKM